LARLASARPARPGLARPARLGPARPARLAWPVLVNQKQKKDEMLKALRALRHAKDAVQQAGRMCSSASTVFLTEESALSDSIRELERYDRN